MEDTLLLPGSPYEWSVTAVVVVCLRYVRTTDTENNEIYPTPFNLIRWGSSYL